MRTRYVCYNDFMCAHVKIEQRLEFGISCLLYLVLVHAVEGLLIPKKLRVGFVFVLIGHEDLDLLEYVSQTHVNHHLSTIVNGKSLMQPLSRCFDLP